MVSITTWVLALSALAVIIAASGAVGVYYSERPHLLFLILLLSFALLFVQFYVLHMDMLASAEQVEGTVVESGWEEGATDDDGETVYYKVTLKYRYEYNGNEYTSDNIETRESVNRVATKADARERASEYDAGDSIDVYVYPDDPTRSYIEPAHFLAAEPYGNALNVALYFWLGGWLLTAGERILVAVLKGFVGKRLEVPG